MCSSGQSNAHGSQAIIHSVSDGNHALHPTQCLGNTTLHPDPTMLQKWVQRSREHPAIHRQAV
jgi:hypothetical protein